MWSKFGDYINILKHSKVFLKYIYLFIYLSDENWETKEIMCKPIEFFSCLKINQWG